MTNPPHTVAILIPAYEPDAQMLDLLAELKKFACPLVLVNDGSGQGYRSLFDQAQKLGATILTSPVNQGKGASLKLGFKYCLDTFSGLIGVVTADADGQHLPQDIKRGVDLLRSNPTKLYLGSRDFSGDDIPAKSKFGNTLTSFLFAKLWKIDIPDTQTGLRAIPAPFMKKNLKLPGNRFEFETEMLKQAADLQQPIATFPITTVYESKDNHQTHFRPLVDSYRIYRLFFATFGRFAISSLSSAVLDLGLFALFLHVLPVSGRVGLATILARMLSASFNYLVNYRLVFQSQASHWHALWRYAALASLQMLLSAAFTSLLANFWPSIVILLKILVDLCLFCLSYLIQQKFVYAKQGGQEKWG